jgi:hypothetical protein
MSWIPNDQVDLNTANPPTTILGAIDAIATQIRLMVGGANWLEAPASTLGVAASSQVMFAILNSAAGDQTQFAGDICSAFQVNIAIEVIGVGAFNNNGQASGTIALQLSSGTTNPVDQSPLISTSLTFGESTNQVSGGYEYVSLPEPVTLEMGTYLICGVGFGPSDPNGNTNLGFAAGDLMQNTANGAITYTGSYYSAVGQDPISDPTGLFAAASLQFEVA